MHFLSSEAFQSKPVTPAEARQIFEAAHTLLAPAVRPHARTAFERLSPPTLASTVEMSRALSRCLRGFQTQAAGGFHTGQGLTQANVEARLRADIIARGGLAFGIECPENSIITTLEHSSSGGELVVYRAGVQIDRAERLTPAGGLPVGTQCFRHEDGCIATGHFASGTRDATRSTANLRTLTRMLTGEQPLSASGRRVTDCFAAFFDANFDVTHPGNIRALVAASTGTGLQLAFPDVRVRKMRIANAPFENNQIHKGGKGGAAESMIMAAPSHRRLTALARERLYVIRDGGLWSVTSQGTPQPVNDTPTFRAVDALSAQLILDHVPLSCRLDGHELTFYNFMEFKGTRGIEAGWYDKDGTPSPFQQAQERFIDWLAAAFSD
jgi:hypothetical protein